MCLRLKFTQNPELRRRLLDTGDAVLVEGNTWHDNYWGTCTFRRCSKTKGKNMLGKLLMQVRQELADGNASAMSSPHSLSHPQ
jgi:ribA/ribD-fused uncharacterized protein